jgi:3-oxoacyl-[acyl-carrier protein] reductase
MITGSSRGIGRATALQFSTEGAYVVVTYRNEQARAEEIVEEICGRNGQAIAVKFDLASIDSIKEAVRRVLSRWGRIDVLVNNAVQWGASRISEAPVFEAFPQTEWQSLLRTNMEGVYATIQSVLPSMRGQGWGRIASVSSIVAEDGLPGSGWYSMVKASVHGLTRTLSKELGPAGILVNCVMPGLTSTDRLALITPEVRQRVERTIPIRRVLTPEDVAVAIVFLCSQANSALTGEILRVGGRA